MGNLAASMGGRRDPWLRVPRRSVHSVTVLQFLRDKRVSMGSFVHASRNKIFRKGGGAGAGPGRRGRRLPSEERRRRDPRRERTSNCHVTCGNSNWLSSRRDGGDELGLARALAHSGRSAPHGSAETTAVIFTSDLHAFKRAPLLAKSGATKEVPTQRTRRPSLSSASESDREALSKTSPRARPI